MNSSLSTLEHFNALTLEGIAVLERLKSQLDSELQALTERNIEQVQQVNTKKQTILAEFDQNNNQRATCLINAGLSVDKQSILALIETTDDSSVQQQFRENWKKLEKTLGETMERNKRNEIVLTRNRQNVEQLLSVLRGQPGKNTLYDAKGGKGNYSGQSRLGKA